MSVAIVQPPRQLELDPTARGFWHESCPKKVRKTYCSAPQLGWSEWISRLDSRKRPKPLARLLPGGRRSLEWSLPDNLRVSTTAELLEALAGIATSKAGARLSLSSQLHSWLSEAPHCFGTERSLEMLAWIESLPAICSMVPEQSWWQLVAEAVRLADDFESANPEVSPLVGQLLDCELKIALGHQLPELRRPHDLGEVGRERLGQTILEVTDESGLAPQCSITEFLPLVASWVRCAAKLRDQGQQPWSKDAQERFDQAICNVFRLMRPDGSLAFENAPRPRTRRKCFEAMQQFVRGRGARRIAQGRARTTKAVKKPKRLPNPAVHSEPACIGILRASWKTCSASLTVDYSGRKVSTELSIDGAVVWSGPISSQLQVAGRPVEISSRWEEVCWVSEEGVDYLELEANAGPHYRVQRQMLLAKADQFLYIADVVLGDQDAVLGYEVAMPLASAMKFKPAMETREGMLVGHKVNTVVLPIGLGEWRTDRTRGELAGQDAVLRLKHSQQTQRMYVPLFLSFDPKRVGRSVTWRQLTVAETREAQPPEVAVGYRVQLDTRQWLFYRSLAPPAIRTVLAQNLKSEFLAARFHRSGKADTIVEVEL